MDKYAVETTKETELDKKAGEAVCPICGAALDEDANVPRCPTHGTAPFEKGAQIPLFKEETRG